MEPQSLLDFDLGEGESSDDSDFRIEDHPEESDDYSINSDDDDKSIVHLFFYKICAFKKKPTILGKCFRFLFFIRSASCRFYGKV